MSSLRLDVITVSFHLHYVVNSVVWCVTLVLHWPLLN